MNETKPRFGVALPSGKGGIRVGAGRPKGSKNLRPRIDVRNLIVDMREGQRELAGLLREVLALLRGQDPAA